MPVNSMYVSSEYNLNTTPSNTLTNNNVGQTNSYLKKVSLIENTFITLVSKKYIHTPLVTIKNFFITTKQKLLGQELSKSPVDIELKNIILEGSELSYDSDIIHSLLNEQHSIVPYSPPSLTTKKGLVLGGLLVTGTIFGSGLYYFQRTGREHSHDIPDNMTNSELSSAVQPPDNMAYSHSLSAGLLPHNNSEILDDDFSRRKRINYNNKRKSAKLKIHYLKNQKSISKNKNKNKNKKPNCHAVNGQKKANTLPSMIYYYSIKQSEVCLTESFNRRCQKAHQQASIKNGCLKTKTQMVLKIQGVYCYCPPADWINPKIVVPPSLRRKTQEPQKKPSTIMPVTTSQLTSFMPIRANDPNIVASSYNDEMTKNRLTHSNSYIIPSRNILDTLPNTTSLIPSMGEDSPDVARVSLVACHDERESLTDLKLYRLVSEVLVNPVTTFLREGTVVIQYSHLNLGCPNNTKFLDIVKKVESAVDSLLAWIPGYDKFRFFCRVVAFIFDSYSDALENKDVNLDSIEDINSRVLGLAKDMTSAISTKDIDILSKKSDYQETKDMVKSLTYKNSDLMLDVGPNKQIKLQKKFNHFSDSESNGFVFYDHEKKWVIDNNVKLNSHIKESFEHAQRRWKDIENIYIFKNSSPNLYGNGVLLKYNKDFYTLINNESKDSDIYKVVEIKLSDTLFRYLVAESDELKPIVYEGESWSFEKETSHYVSEELRNFITYNNKIKDNLVSKNIRHQDVSPLTPGREFQFDKDFNEYIKINDQYFMVKVSKDTSYYIEGSHDLLMLQRSDDGFHIKKTLLDGICCFHKEPLNKIPGMPADEQFFIDNTVISAINALNYNFESKTVIKNIVDNHMKVSPDIKGAIIDEGINYLYYKDGLIQINSNGDDTYTLVDPRDSKNNILIYRNSWSNTYFKLPLKKWQGLSKKSRHCIVKRQPMLTCTFDYFETRRILYLLERHADQGITINDYQNQLEPHEKFHVIYKKKNDDGSLYYKGKDDLFFHVTMNEKLQPSLIHPIFVLYGKDANQQIDLNNIISDVAVIKDIDTKEFIFSTPTEALENFFNIENRFLSMLSKWQQEVDGGIEITSIEQLDIKNKIYSTEDLSNLDELFNRGGKKIITSVDNIDIVLRREISKLSIPDAVHNIEMSSLSNLLEVKSYPLVGDICERAFKRDVHDIKEAIDIIESSPEKMDNYVQHVLGISILKARDAFITSLKKKLERMNMIFDENNKGNIIIIFKKESAEKNKMLLSDKGKAVLGFTFGNDPLDRIFINMAMMADFSSKATSQGGDVDFENPVLAQPDTPRRNRLFFINVIADTMLHESVHAIGNKEDYIYLPKDSEGHIDDIDSAIEHIEDSILDGQMISKEFKYLSKLYFLNNPLYADFNRESLVQPEILRGIFRDDSFFRSIVLLNNPDTIALLVREIAGRTQED